MLDKLELCGNKQTNKPKLLQLCSILGQHHDSKIPGSYLRTERSRVSMMKRVRKKIFYDCTGPN